MSTSLRPLSPLAERLLWMAAGWPAAGADHTVTVAVHWNASFSALQVTAPVAVKWTQVQVKAPACVLRPDWLLGMPWIVQGLLLSGTALQPFDPHTPMGAAEQQRLLQRRELKPLHLELSSNLQRCTGRDRSAQRYRLSLPPRPEERLLRHVTDAASLPPDTPLFLVIRNEHTDATCASQLSVHLANREVVYRASANSLGLAALSAPERDLLTHARALSQPGTELLSSPTLHTLCAWPLCQGAV